MNTLNEQPTQAQLLEDNIWASVQDAHKSESINISLETMTNAISDFNGTIPGEHAEQLAKEELK